MNLPLLETRHLTVRIAGKLVCDDLNLQLKAGECIGILGSNGVGKTTLMHTLAGLRRPANGEVRLLGNTIGGLPRRHIAQHLGLMMQQQQDEGLPVSVLETALMGRHPHIGFWRWESHKDVALARRALKAVGLDGLEQRSQAHLSGGERQRLAAATLLAQDPQIYLLDEPVSQLDLHFQLGLLRLFRDRTRTCHRALMMNLHDVNLAARFCDQLLLLFGEGKTFTGDVHAALSEQRLEKLYGTRIHKVSWQSTAIYIPD